VAREQRKLAAILATDVVGYSRLMGRDESGTLARLREHRKERLEPALARYGGRLVKLTGDGALVEFASAVDALSAAIEFQQAVADKNLERPETELIVFRIGLHLGDLIVDGDDLYGDGVNVAARLEGEAPAGGILISRNVRDAVAGRVKATFEDLGGLSLKNIERPIRAFRVGWDPATWANQTAASEPPAAVGVAPALALPDKPSIAVLPFLNMSGDPEQEYFADGIVEDIITALSRFKSLFIIARNSSFTYKGKAVDVRQVGRELGVRYVLEGSVRKVGGQVRITGQLIDSSTGGHLWADRFDGDLEDVFGLQDRVTSSVIGAIAPKLEQAEIERAVHKPTENLDAYDYYLRGIASMYRWTKEGYSEALPLFYKAIELDPNFASAHGLAAWCYFWRMANAWMIDRAEEIAEATRLANRTAELGKDDAVALSFGGLVLGYFAGDPEAGTVLIDRALVLNPNLAVAWSASGFLRTIFGDLDVAIEHLARAIRFSPLDPLMFFMHHLTALAHYFAGRYDEAWPFAERACREQPHFIGAVRVAAVCYALAGRPDDARRCIARALQLDPELRISNLKNRIGPLRPDAFPGYVEAMRRAGLPE
jgi:TolB-like protein/class 3 adenylate cyclase